MSGSTIFARLLGIRLAGSWTLVSSPGLEGGWSSSQMQGEGIVGEHVVGEACEVSSLRDLHCDFQVQIQERFIECLLCTGHHCRH